MPSQDRQYSHQALCEKARAGYSQKFARTLNPWELVEYLDIVDADEKSKPSHRSETRRNGSATLYSSDEPLSDCSTSPLEKFGDKLRAKMDEKYHQKAVDDTNRYIDRCLDAHDSDYDLYGHFNRARIRAYKQQLKDQRKTDAKFSQQIRELGVEKPGVDDDGRDHKSPCDQSKQQSHEFERSKFSSGGGYTGLETRDTYDSKHFSAKKNVRGIDNSYGRRSSQARGRRESDFDKAMESLDLNKKSEHGRSHHLYDVHSLTSKRTSNISNAMEGHERARNFNPYEMGSSSINAESSTDNEKVRSRGRSSSHCKIIAENEGEESHGRSHSRTWKGEKGDKHPDPEHLSYWHEIKKSDGHRKH